MPRAPRNGRVRPAITGPAGRSIVSDWPKSPCSMPANQCQYCTTSGWFSPSFASSAAIAAGVASRPGWHRRRCRAGCARWRKSAPTSPTGCGPPKTAGAERIRSRPWACMARRHQETRRRPVSEGKPHAPLRVPPPAKGYDGHRNAKSISSSRYHAVWLKTKSRAAGRTSTSDASARSALGLAVGAGEVHRVGEQPARIVVQRMLHGEVVGPSAWPGRRSGAPRSSPRRRRHSCSAIARVPAAAGMQERIGAGIDGRAGEIAVDVERRLAGHLGCRSSTTGCALHARCRSRPGSASC